MHDFFWRSALLALFSPVVTTLAGSLPSPPALDAYGGCCAIQVRATGFFRTERIGERWWLVTPDGHPFFSVGVNTLQMNGSAARGGRCHYLEACQAKYGSKEAWAAAQGERCREWGINTLGCWSDWQAFRKEKIPYTVMLGVDGQEWLKGNWRDIFSEDFRGFVHDRMTKSAAPNRDDPYLLGYWLGNEMKWGPDHRGGHLFDQFLKLPATRAGKQALVAFLRERYGTPERMRKDFFPFISQWSDLSSRTHLIGWGKTATTTKRAWAAFVAERFFSVTAEELRAADPHHLNLGVRFIGQLSPPDVLRAAARHVDVVSVNFYDIGRWLPLTRILFPGHLSVDGFLTEHYRVCGKPILISEWGYRAADSGLPNSWPPIYPTLRDQRARAARSSAYLREALRRPWIVGCHWFEWTDQPREGRFDGENNNFGLVSETDEPYATVAETFRSLHAKIYRTLTP